jgi:hypothetical protein
VRCATRTLLEPAARRGSADFLHRCPAPLVSAVAAERSPHVSSARRQSEALGGLPQPPMIMRHRGVGQAEMGKGVVDRVGKADDGNAFRSAISSRLASATVIAE